MDNENIIKKALEEKALPKLPNASLPEKYPVKHMFEKKEEELWAKK